MEPWQAPTLPADVVAESAVVAVATVLAADAERPRGAGIGAHLTLQKKRSRLKVTLSRNGHSGEREGFFDMLKGIESNRPKRRDKGSFFLLLLLQGIILWSGSDNWSSYLI